LKIAKQAIRKSEQNSEICIAPSCRLTSNPNKQNKISNENERPPGAQILLSPLRQQIFYINHSIAASPVTSNSFIEVIFDPFPGVGGGMGFKSRSLCKYKNTRNGPTINEASHSGQKSSLVNRHSCNSGFANYFKTGNRR
jgi:hypothetical protein